MNAWMTNVQIYASPLGELLLASDGQGLSGCWFEGQKYYAAGFNKDDLVSREDQILFQAKNWLDQYFNGEDPSNKGLKFHPHVTEFRQSVLDVLQSVPYGKVITYQQLAAKVKSQQDSGKYARAIAGAVGHNPLSIFIPCHRVLGSDGSLTGYAGGLKRKRTLLEFEQEPNASFWKK